jgi:hypothetical protein
MTMTFLEILPGTGRWRRGALTEGVRRFPKLRHRPPSTTSLRAAVPLPVPGRI